jgi:hypothetical protein
VEWSVSVSIALRSYNLFSDTDHFIEELLGMAALRALSAGQI